MVLEYLLSIIVIVIAKIFSIFDSSLKCKKCKCKMKQKQSQEFYYLIPIWLDDEYEVTESFYLNNLQLIQNKQQIPTGQRACKMQIYQCEHCGDKKVCIIDFLNVRGHESERNVVVFEYKPFEGLLYKEKILNP